jgi:hypothetical protein
VNPRSGWDDDRLDVAFRARAAGVPDVGADLVSRTLERVKGVRRRGLPAWVVALGGVAASVAVIAVAFGPPRGPASTAGASIDLGKGPAASSLRSQGPATRSPSTAIPTEVLGLGVSSVGKALELHPNFDDAEIAIRGWYVPPPPNLDCPELRERIRPVRPPTCPAGRAWLLDEPEDLWSDPSKVGIDRQPAGAYLNPIIPSDVIFDVPDAWAGDGSSPEPVPVVVIGHFADPRVRDVYAGNETFVVDELAWAAGETRPHRTARLVDDTVESGDDVLARVELAVGPASHTWISLVRGEDLATLDPRVTDSAPELLDAQTVWVLRRLIREELDGIPRMVVDFAYTADRSERVWDGSDCCSLKLATVLEVRLADAGPVASLVRIADYPDTIVWARAGTVAEFDGWRRVGPTEGWSIEVTQGDTPQEVALRWGDDLCNPTWQMTVQEGPWLDLTRQYVEGCDLIDRVTRVVVLTFDEPVNAEDVTANDNTSGG